ncbi:uncharacterized protein PF3D7_1120600 isoform X2 [Hydra vulgaris]|uniref:uncharacterized protein PF3D7_1120600 isoform X2 n=1 Tax=Hydra vulgaris TaxID=6087 RepID=UPI001F5EB676|nr:uncharacterized protein PF3D7_1120600 isoform X2 [Hydra vulgaris]
MESKSNLFGYGSSIYPPIFENEPPPLDEEIPINDDWCNFDSNLEDNEKVECVGTSMLDTKLFNLNQVNTLNNLNSTLFAGSANNFQSEKEGPVLKSELSSSYHDNKKLYSQLCNKKVTSEYNDASNTKNSLNDVIETISLAKICPNEKQELLESNFIDKDFIFTHEKKSVSNLEDSCSHGYTEFNNLDSTEEFQNCSDSHSVSLLDKLDEHLCNIELMKNNKSPKENLKCCNNTHVATVNDDLPIVTTSSIATVNMITLDVCNKELTTSGVITPDTTINDDALKYHILNLPAESSEKVQGGFSNQISEFYEFGNFDPSNLNAFQSKETDFFSTENLQKSKEKIPDQLEKNVSAIIQPEFAEFHNFGNFDTSNLDAFQSKEISFPSSENLKESVIPDQLGKNVSIMIQPEFAEFHDFGNFDANKIDRFQSKNINIPSSENLQKSKECVIPDQLEKNRSTMIQPEFAEFHDFGDSDANNIDTFQSKEINFSSSENIQKSKESVIPDQLEKNRSTMIQPEFAEFHDFGDFDANNIDTFQSKEINFSSSENIQKSKESVIPDQLEKNVSTMIQPEFAEFHDFENFDANNIDTFQSKEINFPSSENIQKSKESVIPDQLEKNISTMIQPEFAEFAEFHDFGNFDANNIDTFQSKEINFPSSENIQKSKESVIPDQSENNVSTMIEPEFAEFCDFETSDTSNINAFQSKEIGLPGSKSLQKLNENMSDQLEKNVSTMMQPEFAEFSDFGDFDANNIDTFQSKEIDSSGSENLQKSKESIIPDQLEKNVSTMMQPEFAEFCDFETSDTSNIDAFQSKEIDLSGLKNLQNTKEIIIPDQLEKNVSTMMQPEFAEFCDFGNFDSTQFFDSSALKIEQDSKESIVIPKLEKQDSIMVKSEYSNFSGFENSVSFSKINTLDKPFFQPMIDVNDEKCKINKTDKYKTFEFGKQNEKVAALYSKASKVLLECFPAIEITSKRLYDLYCHLNNSFLPENELNLWSELQLSGEDAGRWLVQYHLSEHFKKQILSFNISFQPNNDILIPEQVCLPASKNTLLAKSQEKKSFNENISLSKSILENVSGPPSETTSLDLDFFVSNSTAVSGELNRTVSPILDLSNLDLSDKMKIVDFNSEKADQEYSKEISKINFDDGKNIFSLKSFKEPVEKTTVGSILLSPFNSKNVTNEDFSQQIGFEEKKDSLAANFDIENDSQKKIVIEQFVPNKEMENDFKSPDFCYENQKNFNTECFVKNTLKLSCNGGAFENNKLSNEIRKDSGTDSQFSGFESLQSLYSSKDFNDYTEEKSCSYSKKIELNNYKTFNETKDIGFEACNDTRNNVFQTFSEAKSIGNQSFTDAESDFQAFNEFNNAINISHDAYQENKNVDFQTFSGITKIDLHAFKDTKNLDFKAFYDTEKIDFKAFKETSDIDFQTFNNPKSIGSQSFDDNKKINFQANDVNNLEFKAFNNTDNIDSKAFNETSDFDFQNFNNTKSIDLQTFADTKKINFEAFNYTNNLEFKAFNNTENIDFKAFNNTNDIDFQTFNNPKSISSQSFDDNKKINFQAFNDANNLEFKAFNNTENFDSKAFNVTSDFDFHNFNNAKSIDFQTFADTKKINFQAFNDTNNLEFKAFNNTENIDFEAFNDINDIGFQNSNNTNSIGSQSFDDNKKINFQTFNDTNNLDFKTFNSAFNNAENISFNAFNNGENISFKAFNDTNDFQTLNNIKSLQTFNNQNSKSKKFTNTMNNFNPSSDASNIDFLSYCDDSCSEKLNHVFPTENINQNFLSSVQSYNTVKKFDTNIETEMTPKVLPVSFTGLNLCPSSKMDEEHINKPLFSTLDWTDHSSTNSNSQNLFFDLSKNKINNNAEDLNKRFMSKDTIVDSPLSSAIIECEAMTSNQDFGKFKKLNSTDKSEQQLFSGLSFSENKCPDFFSDAVQSKFFSVYSDTSSVLDTGTSMAPSLNTLQPINLFANKPANTQEFSFIQPKTITKNVPSFPIDDPIQSFADSSVQSYDKSLQTAVNVSKTPCTNAVCENTLLNTFYPNSSFMCENSSQYLPNVSGCSNPIFSVSSQVNRLSSVTVSSTENNFIDKYTVLKSLNGNKSFSDFSFENMKKDENIKEPNIVFSKDSKMFSEEQMCQTVVQPGLSKFLSTQNTSAVLSSVDLQDNIEVKNVEFGDFVESKMIVSTSSSDNFNYNYLQSVPDYQLSQKQFQSISQKQPYTFNTHPNDAQCILPQVHQNQLHQNHHILPNKDDQFKCFKLNNQENQLNQLSTLNIQHSAFLQHSATHNAQHPLAPNTHYFVSQNTQHSAPQNTQHSAPQNTQHSAPHNTQYFTPQNTQHSAPQRNNNGRYIQDFSQFRLQQNQVQHYDRLQNQDSLDGFHFQQQISTSNTQTFNSNTQTFATQINNQYPQSFPQFHSNQTPFQYFNKLAKQDNQYQHHDNFNQKYYFQNFDIPHNPNNQCIERLPNQNQFQNIEGIQNQYFQNSDVLHNQKSLYSVNQNIQQPRKSAKTFPSSNDPFSAFSMENSAKQLSLPVANKMTLKNEKVKLKDMPSLKK